MPRVWYAEKDFIPTPRPERCSMMLVPAEVVQGAMLSMGIKTQTHNNQGLRIYPTKVVAVEITEGDRIVSFPLRSDAARIYAQRLNEFADAIDKKEID